MSKLLEIKKELYVLCKKSIQDKLLLSQEEATSLAESLEMELKSSAGDKFETGREMIHSEFQRVQKQIRQTEKQQEVLFRIKPDVQNVKVTLGSLVETNKGTYFFAIPVGRLAIGKDKYFAISLASPIGLALKDKEPGDTVKFNDKKIKIKEIA